jgi:hypothetical protein
MFDAHGMTEPARVAADLAVIRGGLTRPTVSRYAVAPALAPVLPDGLRRGSTVAVAGSVSLLLAVLGAASGDGAWCALVAMPAISAEAASDIGVELTRLPLIPDPGSRWVEVVGALIDAMDVVVARVPARLTDGDIRRLVARARSRGSVLIPFLGHDAAARWPHADVCLTAHAGAWSGIGNGYGRLRRRQVTVVAEGRGQAARPRSTTLWLPAATGGVEPLADQPSAAQLSTAHSSAAQSGAAPLLSVV